jgi:hypothetical protein
VIENIVVIVIVVAAAATTAAVVVVVVVVLVCVRNKPERMIARGWIEEGESYYIRVGL